MKTIYLQQVFLLTILTSLLFGVCCEYFGYVNGSLLKIILPIIAADVILFKEISSSNYHPRLATAYIFTNKGVVQTRYQMTGDINQDIEVTENNFKILNKIKRVFNRF